MWPNPQYPAYLVTFTEKVLNGKLHFLCSEKLATRLVKFGQPWVITVKRIFENMPISWLLNIIISLHLGTWLNITVAFTFLSKMFTVSVKSVCAACHIHTDPFTLMISTVEITNKLNSLFSCVLLAIIPCITNKFS